MKVSADVEAADGTWHTVSGDVDEAHGPEGVRGYVATVDGCPPEISESDAEQALVDAFTTALDALLLDAAIERHEARELDNGGKW